MMLFATVSCTVLSICNNFLGIGSDLPDSWAIFLAEVIRRNLDDVAWGVCYDSSPAYVYIGGLYGGGFNCLALFALILLTWKKVVFLSMISFEDIRFTAVLGLLVLLIEMSKVADSSLWGVISMKLSLLFLNPIITVKQFWLYICFSSELPEQRPLQTQVCLSFHSMLSQSN